MIFTLMPSKGSELCESSDIICIHIPGRKAFYAVSNLLGSPEMTEQRVTFKMKSLRGLHDRFNEKH